MRGYPFFRYVGAMLVGIFLADTGSFSVSWPLAIAIGCGLLFGFLLYQNERRLIKPWSLAQGLAVMGLFVVVGWLSVYLRQPELDAHHLVRARQLPVAYEGVVTNLPEARAKTYKVELDLQRGFDSLNVPYTLTGRVLLYLDKGDSLRPTPQPQYGEKWLVVGPLRPVDGPLNPGEFDYRRFLAHRGIQFQQYVRAAQRRVIGSEPPNWLVARAYQANRWADSVLTSRVGSRAEYGIVNAMLLGVRDDLDPAQYQTYAAAGAVHILSVSGLHVGILFVVLSWVLSKLAPGSVNSWWVVGVKLVVLWFYALMTGFSPPVLRSAFMFSFLLLAGPLNRTQSLMNTLAASALLILCYDPFAAFSAGFQLSYLAVIGIGAWVPYLNQLAKPRSWLGLKLWQMSVVAVAAQLLTFPLALYYFHSFPTYFLLANPIVLTLSAVLVPLSMLVLALSWVPLLGDGLGWVLRLVAEGMNRSVEGVSQLPGAVLDGVWLSGVGMLLLYALLWSGSQLLLTRRRTYLNLTAALSLSLALLVVYEQQQQADQHRLTVHFLPRKTAVSLTSGHHAVVLTDADWTRTPRDYDTYLKNTFGQWGVDTVTVSPLQNDSLPGPLAQFRHPDMALTVWRGRSILIVNRLADYRPWYVPQLIDYLVVRRTAVRDWPTLTRRVVARHVILDDSNLPSPTEQLLAHVPPGMTVHSVRRDGVFMAEW